jgi:hypothetical protein
MTSNPPTRRDVDNRSATEGCINMYDIRLRDRYPSCGMNWPPDLKDVTPYLRVSSRGDLLTLARRRTSSAQRRLLQKTSRMDRMFRHGKQFLPSAKLPPGHHLAALPPRTYAHPPLQRRPGPNLQPSRYRRHDSPSPLAERYRLRRPPRFRTMGSHRTLDGERRTSGLVSVREEFDVCVIL